MHPGYISGSQQLPCPFLPPLPSPPPAAKRLGTYLLAPEEEEEEEEAIFCSSRKRTSRLCGRESSGECSSELLLDALDEDGGAGNHKGEASCDLHVNTRREGLAPEIPGAQGPQIPAISPAEKAINLPYIPVLPVPRSCPGTPLPPQSCGHPTCLAPPGKAACTTKAGMLPSGKSPTGIRQPYS